MLLFIFAKFKRALDLFCPVLNDQSNGMTRSGLTTSERIYAGRIMRTLLV
jgi:hypothetical protein